MTSSEKTRFIVKTAVIAALYATITLSTSNLSYGTVQFRLSEAMTLLAFIDPLYIPGLTLGCVLSNLGSPLGWIDIVLGSTATLLATYSMYLIKKRMGYTLTALIIASLMPALFNGLIVGWELSYLVTGSLGAFKMPFWNSVAYVAAGEFVVVSIFGVVLFKQIIKSDAYLKILKF